jgi:2-octaprenyl-6-methoxyphenol hydroxylase
LLQVISRGRASPYDRVMTTTAKKTRTCDVLVVGGGMVGSAVAPIMAAAGLDVVLVDREDPAVLVSAPFDGRASAIAYASQRLLATTGLWDDMAPHAEPIREIRVSEGRSPFFLHFDHADIGDAPLGFMLQNRHTHAALFMAAERTAGVEIMPRVVVESVDRSGARAIATLSDGRSVSASLVIAADGVRSALREAAGIRTTRWDYRQTAIIATVEHERPHRGIAHEHFLPPGPFAILPLQGNRASLVWTEKTSDAERIMRLERTAFDAEMRRRYGDFMGKVSVVGRRWGYPLRVSLAHQYVAPRLALVGDSAHGMHPLAGQNLNLGYRDVAALVEVVIEAVRLGLDIGQVDVLRRYEAWRRLDNIGMLAVTDGLNRLFSNDIKPVKLARGLGLAAVDRLPGIKQFMMSHARGTFGAKPKLLEGQMV